MKRILLPLLLATVAAPVLALDLTEWGKEGDWVILTDPNYDNSCLTQVSYADGSLLRIGFREKGKKGFVATVNPAWDQFKMDHKYPVTYAVDDSAVIEVEAKGVEVGAARGVEVFFEDPAVLAALVQGNDFKIGFEGAQIASLSLAGSAKALEAASACQVANGG